MIWGLEWLNSFGFKLGVLGRILKVYRGSGIGLFEGGGNFSF